jgi:hypothetical protein
VTDWRRRVMGSWWHRPEPDPRVSVNPRLIVAGQQIAHAFRAFEPVEVILFGSRGPCGQPRPDSDVDFLLISNRKPSGDELNYLAAPIANDLENELGIPRTHLFPRTPDEVRAELEHDGPFLPTAIGKEGLVVYPPERRRSDFARFLSPHRSR